MDQEEVPTAESLAGLRRLQLLRIWQLQTLGDVALVGAEQFVSMVGAHSRADFEHHVSELLLLEVQQVLAFHQLLAEHVLGDAPNPKSSYQKAALTTRSS